MTGSRAAISTAFGTPPSWLIDSALRGDGMYRRVEYSTYCITDSADGTSDLSAARGVIDSSAFAPD